jgi:CRP/FNR family transcriptional regulator/CRP/FNR family cyclic AMP-dependent transcriptional regulator
MSKVDLLKSVSLFVALSEKDLAVLANSLRKHVFDKGMIIFHQGSPGQRLYIIESGRVRIFLLSESGQQVSLNLFGPGDIFGELSLLDGLPRSAGAIAIEKTLIYTLHRDDFLHHLETYPRMAISILETVSARLRYTATYAENLAFLDVYGRVATKLLELADRYGIHCDGIEIDLRLTQVDLASWVGASRESVNKALGLFRDRGWIRIESKTITVLDRSGLQNQIQY